MTDRQTLKKLRARREKRRDLILVALFFASAFAIILGVTFSLPADYVVDPAISFN